MIRTLRLRQQALAAAAALALVLGLGVTAARAEDPGVQRQMAANFGEKLGLGVDEAQARLDRQDRLVQVADQIRERLGDAYAGVWFDQADRGRMKVGIAATASDKDPGLVKAVEGILAAEDATDDADLVRVAETEAELEAQQDRLNDALADRLQKGQVSTGIDPATNAVTVKVASDASASVQADIAQAVSDGRGNTRVEGAAGAAWSFDTCGRRSGDNFLFCGNPFRGAVAIGTNAPQYCSAGFVTLGNSGGSPWLMTAGHCLALSGTAMWSSRDASLTLHDIGTRHSYTLGTGGDYGITGFSTTYWNTSPYVVYDGASTLNETYHIYDAGTSYVGMAICGSGMRLLSNGHSTDCGTVTALNVTAYPNGVQVQHLGEANTCTGVDGDSGGPYYKNGHGYGMLSASNSTCDILYQGLSGALSGSNVHLVG